MAKKAVVTGQFNLVNESSGQNIFSFDLATAFSTLTGILEFNNIERQVSSVDGVVSLDKGGVSNIRGFYLAITEGTGPVVVKHDSNTNGMSIDTAVLLFGEIDSVTVETASAQPVTIEYLFFE